MAVYTGTLVDCGLASLAPYAPQLEFILSQESFALSTNHVLTRRPVRVTPASNGSFTVNLVPNDDIQGSTTYLMRAVWLDSAGSFTSLDLYEIYARTGGGPITNMQAASGAWNPAQVFWQPDQPNPWPRGWIWINSENGDVKRSA